MTREEYLQKLLYDHNKSKEKQTAAANKYPQGYFKPKKCRKCGKVFTPKAPSEHYCCEYCKQYGEADVYYKRLYGISVEEYLDLAEKQNFVCALCGKPNFAMRNVHSGCLVVDNDHKTGKVRGLLCHNCNRALGLLHDNADLMLKAAEYVKV